MITEKTIEIENIKQMHDFAYSIAEKVTAPLFIALNGDLGAGKTEFVRGFMRYYNDDRDILLRSPTYTIVNEYHLNETVYHFDVYRLNDSEELYQIGFDDYTSENAIFLVEWADKFPEIYPEEYIDIRIFGNGMDKRSLNIRYTDSFKEVFK